MSNTDFMNMLNCIDQLMKKLTRFFFFNSFFFDYIVKELTVFHELHYQQQIFGSFHNIVQLHDVRVPHQFQDMDFTEYSFSICDIIYFIFFKYFNGNTLISDFVDSQFYLAESALPQSLTYAIYKIYPRCNLQFRRTIEDSSSLYLSCQFITFPFLI